MKNLKNLYKSITNVSGKILTTVTVALNLLKMGLKIKKSFTAAAETILKK